MKTEIPIKDRYGYQIIDTPELKKKFGPKLATDEVTCPCASCLSQPVAWSEASRDGCFDSDSIYRRKIEMESGYELVPLDGQFADGDEYTHDGTLWFPAGRMITATPSANFKLFQRSSILAFRRKSQSSNSNWIRISDRLPRADEYPVWVTDGKRVETSFEPFQTGTKRHGKPCTHHPIPLALDDEVTHWQPKPKDVKPEPPKPEQSEEEKAFEKAVEEVKFYRLKVCGEAGFTLPESFVAARMIWDLSKSFAQSKGAK